MTTYEWVRVAFKWVGACDICGGWTKGGVRRCGYKRFRHLCEACARNRFAFEITTGLSRSEAESNETAR